MKRYNEKEGKGNGVKATKAKAQESFPTARCCCYMNSATDRREMFKTCGNEGLEHKCLNSSYIQNWSTERESTVALENTLKSL